MSETPVTLEIDEENGKFVLARIFYVGVTAEEAMKNYNDGIGYLTRVIRDAVVLGLCKLLGFNNPGEFAAEFTRLRELETNLPKLVDDKIEAYFNSLPKIDRLAGKIAASNAKRRDNVRDIARERILELLPKVWKENLQWGEFASSDITTAMIDFILPNRGEWMINSQDTDETAKTKLSAWLEVVASDFANQILQHLGYTKMPPAQKASIIAVSRLCLKQYGMKNEDFLKFVEHQVANGVLAMKK